MRKVLAVGILIGLVVTLGCVLGGFMAMGGHRRRAGQPWEAVIICGAALGTFLVANPMKTVKDTGKGLSRGVQAGGAQGAATIWRRSACCTA